MNSELKLKRSNSSRSLHNNDPRRLLILPESESINRMRYNNRKNFSFSGVSNKDRPKQEDNNDDENIYQLNTESFGLPLSSIDLEWDRHKDFVPMVESDTMSSYDLDEQMTELIKQKFLEFEMMSNASVRSVHFLNGKNITGVLVQWQQIIIISMMNQLLIS